MTFLKFLSIIEENSFIYEQIKKAKDPSDLSSLLKDIYNLPESEILKMKQYELQLSLQSKGFNIVTCCNCDAVLIHEKDEESTKCFSCMELIYFENCSDLNYI